MIKRVEKVTLVTKREKNKGEAVHRGKKVFWVPYLEAAIH